MLYACCRQADQRFDGLLDILINNVGTNIRKTSLDYTGEEYAFVMDTNLSSLFLLTLVRCDPPANTDLALCISGTDVRCDCLLRGQEVEALLLTGVR